LRYTPNLFSKPKQNYTFIQTKYDSIRIIYSSKATKPSLYKPSIMQPRKYTQELDKLAENMFGEFGYDTCSNDEKIQIIQCFLK